MFMKGYVVTLMDDPRSVKVAERCIASGAKYDIDIEMFPAATKGELDDLFVAKFDTKYSDTRSLLSNFVTQYRIWQLITAPTLIFEHDAVIHAPMTEQPFRHIMNVGMPSFGKYKQVSASGVWPFFSKAGGYFGGAHAYAVTTIGARMLTHMALSKGAGPCDLFLCKENFPSLQELYPWIARVDETFSTIQKKQGCLAKHQFKNGYDHLV